MGMNSGVHDAFNLADKLIRIMRRETDDSELDRYERQRRHVAIKHTQAQTMRNKRLLAEQDPAVRQRNNEELRRTAEDPARPRLPAAQLADREPARGRADRVSRIGKTEAPARVTRLHMQRQERRRGEGALARTLHSRLSCCAGQRVIK